MSNKIFTILDKKYHRNLSNKVNTVYFRYDDKDYEIDVAYIKTYNRYVFTRRFRETLKEYKERMAKMGLDTKEAEDEFLMALQKYSRLGQMKGW